MSRSPNAAASDVVRAGFIPLVDCAPIVIAAEKGFAEANGFKLVLSREASWANIRDKMEYGAFECAHMLAPMVIANALRLTHATKPVIAPMVLNQGGSAITVASRVADEMLALDAENARAGGLGAARAFARVVRARQAGAQAPLMLGMVYPFSSHNYDLRFWLASAGLDPDEDVSLVVIPPPLLAESLAAGRIDGFCVGSPWSSVAVAAGGGRIVATKAELWAHAPEKVLGVRFDFHERNGELLACLIRAVAQAQQWLDVPGNRAEAASILGKPQFVGVDRELIERALQGRLERAPLGVTRADDEFLVFARHHANFPWRSHAMWLMTQMIRWGQVRRPFDMRAVADTVYRPDIYRAATASLGLVAPKSDYRLEGPALDLLDPSAPVDYVAAQPIRARTLDLAAFSAANS